MSALFEIFGAVLGETFGQSEEDRSRGDADVLIDGEWQEGELFFGPTKIIWDERIIFSDAEGRVEQIVDQDPPHPNFVVLRFRRPHDVVHLAVHHRELKRVGAVLTLPL
ncbi:hypothetical protein [Lentzea sp. NBRC 102530]|uniref:hypothetical protein n=1 Tax=Lentzea sp. NBRC 102530 TaxID=3032201 RepID=UPI0024A0F68D|nr:hypothetical protein [Lentzea sp. NBRC 102530]GLY48373.1 hypothetical protein Lesp01_20290 [Lentzea sp. NBRC 102530]